MFCPTSQAQTNEPFQLPAGVTEADYVPGMIIVKVRSSPAASPQSPTSRTAYASPLETIRQLCRATRISPIIAPAGPLQLQARTAAHPLANIYKIETNEADILPLLQQLQQQDEVEYAEPYYLLLPLNRYVPNDPAADDDSGEQDYLATVHAYEAWAIEKSNADMLIGILDTGVEFGHQDLTDNLYVNSADPINGIDDDGDGYTDNYVGWDMANDDNDPTADTNGHGTLVAGVAAATPDNEKGMAGLGFHSSYMPIKIFRSGNDAFAFGYEAIAYAADRGCKVINLSWGGANAYSRFGEEIINYAVLEKDAVIVAAAGNSGKEEKFYPASYDYVLSVAVTDAQDNRVAQTTYNYWIDMVAPGNRNYSTRNNDGYSYTSGSSFSAPMVAGAAALVRAHFPQLSALQVMQQLRMSADDIYAVGSNATYREKLGRGRLNAARALQVLRTPAVRAESIAYANHTGVYAYYGDTLQIHALFKNYLSPASNVSVTLSCASPYVTVLDSVVQLGAIDSLAEATHAANPFTVYLHEDLPTNQELVFRLGFSASGYRDYQYVSITSSSEYITLNHGKMAFSVGSNSDLGHNPTAYDAHPGVWYQQQSVAPQLGVMVATEATSVSDNVIQSYRSRVRGQDFTTEQSIKLLRSPIGGPMVRSSFSDAAAPQPIGVSLEQTWLTDTSAKREVFWVGEYRVTNTSGNPLSNVQVGLFADWDLTATHTDRADWDAAHQLGYAYNEQEQRYTGVALLTPQTPSYYALDQESYHGNVADTEGEYTDEIKYGFLSQGVMKTQAGTQGAGNNIAHVVGATTPLLEAREATRVSFALVAGNTLEELQLATQAAQAYYARYRRNPLTRLSIPVCAGQTATVQIPGETTLRFYRDPLGTQLLGEGSTYQTGVISEDTAIYVAPVRNGYQTPVTRVAIRITEPVARFTFDDASNQGAYNDTLFLDESANVALRFLDQSEHAVAWRWDFGNGFHSTGQHPTTRYTTPGHYTISLTITSGPGCTSQTNRSLTVVRRANRPIIADRTVCPGSSVTLQASNTQQLKVYGDEALTNLLFTGERFTRDTIEQTTHFYVVNVAEAIPSVAHPVRVQVAPPSVAIHYALDTTDIAQPYLLRLQAQGDHAVIDGLAWYVNGTYAGDASEFTYDFSAEHAQEMTITLALEYTQHNGERSCAYHLSEEIRLSTSPAPDFASLRLCQGESAMLRPANGTVFYFYLDEQRDSLVHKGRFLALDALAQDKTYYVTNMSGLLESNPTRVDVMLNSFADFQMSADTLYLSETNEAVFEAFASGKADPAEVSWQWDLGDGTLSHQTSRVTQQFDSVGTYQIRLLAQTAEGCTNTVTRTLVVEEVTGLHKNQEEEAFRLYPNPTSGEVFLENRFWFQKNISLRLFTLQGQEIARQDMFYDAFPLPINLHHLTSSPLPNGLYLLHIHREGRVFVRKLYIE